MCWRHPSPACAGGPGARSAHPHDSPFEMKTNHLLLAALAALPPLAHGQATIDLGSATGFAVLAGSGLSVAGAVSSTAITGDIGSFPTPAITGLENVVLNGVNHAGDAVTQAA